MQVSCKYLLNSLASIYCKINMQVSYLYLVPFLAHLLARCARKWPNYVQDSKISASCARLYIHTATFLARTRSASSCKVTQVYSTWAIALPQYIYSCLQLSSIACSGTVATDFFCPSIVRFFSKSSIECSTRIVLLSYMVDSVGLICNSRMVYTVGDL